MDIVRGRGGSGQHGQQPADDGAGSHAAGRCQQGEAGGPLRAGREQFPQGGGAGTGGQGNSHTLQRPAGRKCQQAPGLRENPPAGQPCQDGKNERSPPANMVGPVAGQHQRGHQRQDVAGEGRGDAERREAQVCLQQRVEGRGQVRADQQQGDDGAGHHQPGGGGGIPAPARGCGRAHAEFTEDCHWRCLGICRGWWSLWDAPRGVQWIAKS